MAAETGPEIDEAHPPLVVRRVEFDWQSTPLHWIPGNPAATHTVNVLHLMLPPGERWFVQVFRDALPYVEDERLRAEVKGFMGQEAVHARAHADVVAHQLDREGVVNNHRFNKLVNRVLKRRDKRMSGLPPRRRRRLLHVELASIAAIEHYTAVLGQWMLDNQALDRAGTDPVMLDLLRWHAAEEVEHRSVAFDLFQHVSGSYPLRLVSWAFATTGLTAGFAVGGLFLARRDPTLPRKPTFAEFWRAQGAAAKAGLIPPRTILFKEAPAYLKRSHHPSKVCSTERAVRYLRTSPAARAAGYDPY